MSRRVLVRTSLAGMAVVIAGVLGVWLALPSQAQQLESIASSDRAAQRAAYAASIRNPTKSPERLASEARAAAAAACPSNTSGWVNREDEQVTCVAICSSNADCPTGSRCALQREYTDDIAPDEVLYADSTELRADETGLCFTPYQLHAADSPKLAEAIAEQTALDAEHPGTR